MATRIAGNVIIEGDLTIGGTKPAYDRADFASESAAAYQIPLTELRVWDNHTALLPQTPATDDLGIVEGTWATDFATVQTGDLKAAGSTTRYATFYFGMPAEYVATGTVSIKVHAGMLTTVADTAATIDFECYKSDKEAGIGSDLVTTAATTVNSLTLATKTFAVTSSGLAAGDLLAVRMAFLVNDGATGTAVTGIVGDLQMALDVKG